MVHRTTSHPADPVPRSWRQKNNVEAFSVSGELNASRRCRSGRSRSRRSGTSSTGTQVFTYSFNQPVGKVIHTGTSPGDGHLSAHRRLERRRAREDARRDVEQLLEDQAVPDASVRPPKSRSTRSGSRPRTAPIASRPAHGLSLKTYPFNQTDPGELVHRGVHLREAARASPAIYFWGSYLTENERQAPHVAELRGAAEHAAAHPKGSSRSASQAASEPLAL